MYKSHSSTCYCLCVFVKTGIQTVEFGVNVCYDLFQQLLPWMTIKSNTSQCYKLFDEQRQSFLPHMHGWIPHTFNSLHKILASV